jgi:hypothetical protein
MTSIHVMSRHDYWQWRHRCQVDNRPNNLVGWPMVLDSDRLHDPHAAREYSQAFWGWVRRTKRVDVQRLKSGRTVGEVKKVRDMAFRFANLVARRELGRDFALYTDLYVNPPVQDDSSLRSDPSRQDDSSD